MAVKKYLYYNRAVKINMCNYFYFMAILMLSHLFFSYFNLANPYFIPSLPDEENRASILNLFLSKRERSWVFYLYFPIKSWKIDCLIPIFLWVAKAMTCSFAK